MRAVILAGALALLTTGCAHSIHEVHVSDFNPPASVKDGQMIKVQTEQFVILGFTSQTDYVDKAYNQLMDKCPVGVITGITTQYSTSLSFFSWTNKILMQGLCLKVKGSGNS